MMNNSVKDRWINPRGTIAQKFKDNDYGYVLHAGKLFLEFLDASKLTFSDIKKLKILDYGCGTARVARFFSMTGAWVECYDPTPECIDEAIKENDKAIITSSFPKNITSEIDVLSKNFNLIYCINVLEHLTPDEFSIAIKNINSLLVEGGECYLWLSKNNKLVKFLNKDDYDKLNLSTSIIVAKGKKVNGVLSPLTICAY